jgi:hypothetical protein
MGTPIENLAIAAVENNQVVLADSLRASASAYAQATSSDAEYSDDSDIESSASLKQGTDENEPTQVCRLIHCQRMWAHIRYQASRFDILFEACDELHDQMFETSTWLRDLMLQRAKFRIDHPRIISYRVQIRHVPEQMLRRLRRKQKIEKEISEALSDNQICYKSINHTVQVILEMYSDVRSGASHTAECADFEDAIYALCYLESVNGSFRQWVKSLLHTVFLPDSKASYYLMSLLSTCRPYYATY